ncbi:MAG: hypothetical protein L3V56_07445, partial [Candidatus Magnetoovum sp. WYHC-5]|nr:hypothetical protein [Candidatus Magnetoovum sp. WYHC-5]
VLEKKVHALRQSYRGNFLNITISSYTKTVDDLAKEILRKQKVIPSRYPYYAAKLSRNIVTGIPILLGIIGLMYIMIVDVASGISGWMEDILWTPIEDKIHAIVGVGFWNDFLIGQYGVLSLGLSNALITVLPILSVFFILFNILEDIGYIPNITVLTRRIFSKFGLSASSIQPIVLGFGCQTMATLTTKSINSKKEKYIAIFLISLAIPCAGQLGINLSILGKLGFKAFMLTFLVLLFVEIIVGFILNKFIKQDVTNDFIQELPPMRLPNINAVLKKTYYRLYWFLQEAVPVFIYAAIALFLLEQLGILRVIKYILSPFIETVIGLPVDMVDALILIMARKEAAAALLINFIDSGKLNYIQTIVSVVLTTLFIPCFATIGVMIKELGAKKAIVTTVVINVIAFSVAGLLHWILLFFG